MSHFRFPKRRWKVVERPSNSVVGRYWTRHGAEVAAGAWAATAARVLGPSRRLYMVVREGVR